LKEREIAGQCRETGHFGTPPRPMPNRIALRDQHIALDRKACVDLARPVLRHLRRPRVLTGVSLPA